MLEKGSSLPRAKLGIRGGVLAVALLLIVAILTPGCSKESRRDRYIERADRYYDAGDFPKATIEYMNALKLDSQNLRCAQRLGLIAFAQGQLGRAHAFLSHYHTQKPGDIEVMTRLLRIYREARDFTRGGTMAADILKLEPANAEALLTLADFAATPEQNADLNARIEKLKQTGSNPAVVQLAIGLGQLKRREFEQGEASLKQAATLDPKLPFVHAALGNYFAMRGDIESAFKHFELQLEAAPKDLFARVRVAEFRARTGNVSEAKTELETITAKHPEFVPAWNQLGAIAFAERRFEDAESHASKVLAIEPVDFNALLLKARLSMATTNIAQAILQFQQLARLNPKVPQIPLELARAYLATNDTIAALSALDQSLAINPNLADALFLKAQVTFRQGDLTATAALLDRLLQQNPKLVPARLALAEVHRARGDQNEALKIYAELIQAFPTNAYPRYVQGMAYFEQAKPSEAEASFRKALELDPKHLPSLLQLAEIQLQQRRLDDADRTWKVMDELAPKDGTVSLLRARIQLARGDSAGAETSLREAIDLNPSLSSAYDLLSKIYIASNRTSEALANFDAALARFPGNVAVLLQKAALHHATSNYVECAAAYERALTNAPQLVIALNNLAYLYLEKLNKPDQAYDFARRARQLVPDEPSVADTFGWAQYHRKEYAQALVTLSEAAAKLPREPEAQFHLGMAHYQNGNETEAANALGKALALSTNFSGASEAQRRLQLLSELSQPVSGENVAERKALLEKQNDDPIALNHLAKIQLNEGDRTSAKNSLERLVTLTPRSVPTLLTLARLNAADNPRRSLELARQARTVDARNPEVAHAVGTYALSCGEYDWALNVLQEQVNAQQHPSAELLYDFAVALHAVGRTDDSTAQAKKALNLAQTPAQKSAADQLLRFLNADTNPPPALVTEATNLLSSSPRFLPALMVLGTSQAQSGDITGARQTFTKVLELSPKFAPALRSIVTLSSTGETDARFHEWAIAARKAFPKDPAVALAAGRALYRKGDFQAARAPLQEAAAAFADNGEAIFYLGMNRLKTGDRARGVEDIKRATNLGLPAALSAEASKVLVDAQLSGAR